jgi:two-component system NtrC family sensor kinase
MTTTQQWPGARSRVRNHGRFLRWRIVGILLAVSLLPLVLVGLGSIVVFGGLLEERSLELQRQVVQSHADAIERYLIERRRALELVARTHDVDHLAASGTLAHVFESLSASVPGAFVDLGVIGEDGQHLAYVGPYDLADKNYRSATWFRSVLAGDVYVSDVFLGFRQVPHFVMAVKRTQAGRTWVLRATLNSEDFDTLVRHQGLSDTADAFLVNDQGLYQTAPRSGRVLDRARIDPPLVHQGFRQHRAVVDGVPSVRTSTWVHGNRWMLVVQEAERTIQAPLRRAFVNGVLVVSLAVFLLVVTTVLATWHLIRQVDRANAQRDAMSDDLLRSAKLASLGELATGLAHEINNPLAIISAEQTNISDGVQDLALPPDVEKRLLDSVRRCRRQIERCSSITSKMLQFGRRTDAQLRPTAIAPLLDETVRLLHRQAAVRNVELRLAVAPDLPPLLVDGTELEQVVVNLINNALYAIEGSGVIEVSARRAGKEVRLAVKDNGAGIAREHLDRIFQPFFTTKPVGQGTGLGLSVCYGIVRGWGGTIEAASEPGRGTEMIIHVPVPTATEEQQASPAPAGA